MALVPARCTQCGGDLQIDNTKEAAVCSYCGSAFVVEKAINNYNHTYNITADNVNVYQQGGGRDSADKLYEAGIKALNSQNNKLAEKCFDDLKKYYPSDYRGPLGKMKCYSHSHASSVVIKIIKEEFDNACSLADSEQNKIVVSTYNEIITKLNAEIQRLSDESNAKRNEKIREQTLNAQMELEKVQKELYSAIVVMIIFCAPFICSFIFEVSTFMRVLLGILFFCGIVSLGIILGNIMPEVKKAEKHYQQCKSGDYQKELENSW